MGSSGGIPSLGGSGGGFFPSGMQMNPGGLPIMDLMGWANSGGMQAQPLDQSLLGPIFGQPPPPQAAPPPQPMMRQQQAPERRPGKEQFQSFGELANMIRSGQRPRGSNNPRYSR